MLLCELPTTKQKGAHDDRPNDDIAEVPAQAGDQPGRGLSARSGAGDDADADRTGSGSTDRRGALRAQPGSDHLPQGLPRTGMGERRAFDPVAVYGQTVAQQASDIMVEAFYEVNVLNVSDITDGAVDFRHCAMTLQIPRRLTFLTVDSLSHKRWSIQFSCREL